MPPRSYATVGRAADNDVVLDHPSVSNHHARLSWAGSALLVEDLSSANGTFIEGQRVKAARARPGAELRLGQVVLPWSHEGLRTLLKAGIGARTLVMPAAGSPAFVCGACGRVAPLAQGPRPKSVTCPGCGATLRTATKPRGESTSPAWLLGAALGVGAALIVYAGTTRFGVPNVPTSPEQVVGTLRSLEAAEQIGAGTAERIAKAITPMDSVTRDAAVKLASRSQGPFHVEQVAEIWNAVRSAWHYVNDPQRNEYFATASETIQNGYVGDCDDFATTLASMVIAIGGDARVVVMNGPGGGHAYAEACVQGDPQKLAGELGKYYRSRFKRYLAGRAVPRTIAYRSTEACPIWLNLDWNSVVPGGEYQPEEWAVAVYQDGHAEVLTPASAAAPPALSDSKTRGARE